MWHVWETRDDWWGEPMEIDYLEGLGVDGRILLSWISKKKKGIGRHGIIDLTQDRDRWRTTVNAATNLVVP